MSDSSDSFKSDGSSFENTTNLRILNNIEMSAGESRKIRELDVGNVRS